MKLLSGGKIGDDGCEFLRIIFYSIFAFPAVLLTLFAQCTFDWFPHSAKKIISKYTLLMPQQFRCLRFFSPQTFLWAWDIVDLHRPIKTRYQLPWVHFQ